MSWAVIGIGILFVLGASAILGAQVLGQIARAVGA